MPPLVLVEDLHYAYPPPLPGAPPTEVLRGVEFQVEAGEFVALLGRVGAGKTTLCMALNGLAPRATGGVFRGNVTVAGRNTRREPVPGMARFVSLVFQDPETQMTQMQVEDEVAFGPENLGLSPAEIGKRMAWAMAAVGMSEHRERSPLRLSGGEKQRVAIAAMLAMHPALLVLDEPTANLDPAGKASIFNVLLRLARERQVAIFTATQEVERAARYADRILVLHEGRIALQGPPEHVFSQVDRLREWGVSLPELAELAHLLAQRTSHAYDFRSPGRFYTQLRRDIRSKITPAAQQTQDYQSPPTIRPAAQIALENVSFTYPDGTPALRNVTLSVAAGEFVALLGPNGSGKTTLAKHLNGLLRPSAGRVLLNGADTRPVRTAALARSVGYVFQNPDHQIFAPSVEEEISFGIRLQGHAEDEVRRRTGEIIARFGLGPLAQRPPAILGSGQRRQVALAAVLATEPPVLLLDEPTGGLDRQSRTELMAEVTAYHRRGHTIILITHDMRLVAEHAQRAIVMLDGRVRFDGAPAELFGRPELVHEARLVTPPVVRLAQRLAAYGFTGATSAGVTSAAEFVAAYEGTLERVRRDER
jgi:energy-coupling factor transport system ATP-binding protein